MKNNKGFSLVELIVVIAIMAVLVGVLAPTLLRYVEKSRVQKDDSAVAEVVQAVKIALADEDINDECAANDTVVVTASGYTVNVAKEGATLLAAELDATIGDFTLSSKDRSAKSYTITITEGADGLTVENFDKANWAAAGNNQGGQQNP